MTLRIFEQADDREAVIALHGWLSASEAGEVERLVAGCRDRPVRIDLSQLAGVDTEGLRALARLRAGGARLAAATPYVELLLQRTVEPGREGP